MTKKYDIVVFGATSFVGQILTKYLWTTYGQGKGLNWALAGRSQGKLNELKQSLGSGAAELPTLIADAANESDLQALCAQTKVIASTVGPYALYGSPLVKVCAETGTDYCDLTGEVQWIDRMVKAHEATAQKSGARIVHCCGFDSIPSDMGVYFLQQQAKANLGSTCSQVKMRVKAAKGGFSGGTVASLMNVMREIAKDPSIGKAMANPYLIAPANLGVRQPNVNAAQYEKETGTWVAPFIMAGINTRVVHRSNGLLNNAYGKQFKYDEAMMTGKGFKGAAMAAAVTAGLGGFILGAAIPPTRWVLEKFVVPKPGEGPSLEAQNSGYYDLRFFGTTDDGKAITVKVKGDKDPGYGSTGKMLGEAAVCLAKDKASTTGGFWTPSTAMGDQLLERLQGKAGLSFTVV